MSLLDEVLGRVRAAAEGTGYEEQAAAVAKDAAYLITRQLAGEDVERELTHVAAQAMNLSRAVRAAIQSEVMSWVGSQVHSVLLKLLRTP